MCSPDREGGIRPRAVSGMARQDPSLKKRSAAERVCHPAAAPEPGSALTLTPLPSYLDCLTSSHLPFLPPFVQHVGFRLFSSTTRLVSHIALFLSSLLQIRRIHSPRNPHSLIIRHPTTPSCPNLQPHLNLSLLNGPGLPTLQREPTDLLQSLVSARLDSGCISTTPPISRKRKVTEVIDSASSAPSKAPATKRTTSSSRKSSFPESEGFLSQDQKTAAASRPSRRSATTPPAEATFEQLPQGSRRSTRKKVPGQAVRQEISAVEAAPTCSGNKQPGHKIVAPQTPASTLMDSDDDFNSVASSDAFNMEEDDQDSDISLDGGDDMGFDDADTGFELHDKDLQPKRPSYQVEFKVYSPADIQAYQKKQIDEIAMITNQPPEAAAILLRHARWNKERLVESYMDNQEAMLEDAGLSQAPNKAPQIKRMPRFECGICCDDTPNRDTFAMKCGHRFCVDCYRQYLHQKIKEEGEAARIRCPGDDCNKIIDSNSLDILVSEDLRQRYTELLTRTYVDDKENLKWCPAPNCEYAVDCAVKAKDLGQKVPTVQCACGHPFCFGCSLADHQPAPCSLVKKWLKKCEDDSETANWISAHTKECPKCYSTIEKNGGCNHMTCRKCRHEFCWMCMGVWSEHGTSWYNCNRYEEKSGSEARDAQAKSRQSLERYLHYYNRYANHEHSAKLDKDIALKAEKKMTQLQTNSNLSWIEVQFVNNASECLQQCRQTLKWTYAFAYYLARNNQTEMFEDNQKDLELAVENLSEMFEKPTDQLAGLKVEMMDKISYCTKRRTILLTTTADELLAGGWKFNVELIG